MIRARNSERGIAIVEFAILVPALMMLLIGLIEMGRFAYYSIIVANAARAGAQYGAQNLVTAADSTGMKQAALNDGQNISGLTVPTPPSYSCQCADGTASTCEATDCSSSHRLTYVQVDTRGTYSSLFNYPGLPSTFTVNSQAIMQVGQ